MISASQYKRAAVLPIVPSLMSVTGSALIIVVILRSNKRLSTTYRRLVFGMSLMDICFSIAYLFSTLPSPKDTPTLWKALGNTHTCTLQGLCIFFGSLGATMYSCALSTFFFLTVGKQVRKKVMSTIIEPCFHAIILLYLFSVSIYLLYTQSFNTYGTVCLVTPYPRGCDLHPDDMQCTRGVNARKYFWYFMGYPVIGIFVIILVNMLLLYLNVKAQFRKMEQYRTMAYVNNATLPSGIQALRRNSITLSSNRLDDDNVVENEEQTSTVTRRRPRVNPYEWAVATQCFFYVSAYFITWVWAAVFRMHITITGEWNYTLWMLSQAFTPLQGFLNFLVFIRTHVISIRGDDSSLSYKSALWIAISKSDINYDFMRRRRSLLNRQQNGGSRYTAREWHLRESQIHRLENPTTTTATSKRSNDVTLIPSQKTRGDNENSSACQLETLVQYKNRDHNNDVTNEDVCGFLEGLKDTEGEETEGFESDRYNQEV